MTDLVQKAKGPSVQEVAEPGMAAKNFLGKATTSLNLAGSLNQPPQETLSETASRILQEIGEETAKISGHDLSQYALNSYPLNTHAPGTNTGPSLRNNPIQHLTNALDMSRLLGFVEEVNYEDKPRVPNAA